MLKRTHKNLMILEAGYVYCKRHNLNYQTFIDDVFMQENFDCEEEYQMCINKFGEQKLQIPR